MCVCVYICMCIYMCVCIYMYIYVYIYIYILFGTLNSGKKLLQVTPNSQRQHFIIFFFNFFFNPHSLLFIYLFMAVLGLRFCARAFSSCGKWGPLFIAVRGPLTIAGSPVAEHRLQSRRLSNCGSRAQLLCGMWDLPRPGPEPMSPASAGRLPTTAPPGKPSISLLKHILRQIVRQSHSFCAQE